MHNHMQNFTAYFCLFLIAASLSYLIISDISQTTCILFILLFIAFKYRDSHHNGKSLLEAENMIDEVRHHRYRREVRLINNTDCQNSSNSLLCNDTTTKVSFIY